MATIEQNIIISPFYAQRAQKASAKIKSYIYDIELVKLSLRIFFFLNCLMKNLFHQISGSTVICVKNIHQNIANLKFSLISPAGMVPWWFLVVKYKGFTPPPYPRRRIL